MINKPIRALFVTWDGPQSDYLESLFLPILARVSELGDSFEVLHFTWGPTETRERMRAAAHAVGIDYTSVKVWRRPVAAGSFATAIWASRLIEKLVRRNGIDLVLARSIMPALATLLALKSLKDVSFQFDADGLPIDERIEFANMNPGSLSAMLLRAIEATATRVADVVLTRSVEASRILLARAGAGTDPTKFFRVPNCRDEQQFHPASLPERACVREALGVSSTATLIGYVGSSLSGKYDGASLIKFFQMVTTLRRNTHLLILTAAPAEALTMIRAIAPSCEDRCHVLRVRPSEVSKYLGACDVGLALIEPSFSMQAASAVKVGEYLLSGLPVVSTAGIGDAAQFLPSEVCYFVPDHSTAHLADAAKWFVSLDLVNRAELAKAARAAGLLHYGFAAGIAPYQTALSRGLLARTERNKSISCVA